MCLHQCDPNHQARHYRADEPEAASHDGGARGFGVSGLPAEGRRRTSSAAVSINHDIKVKVNQICYIDIYSADWAGSPVWYHLTPQVLFHLKQEQTRPWTHDVHHFFQLLG